MKITNVQKYTGIGLGAATLLATRAQFASAACDPTSGSAAQGAACAAGTNAPTNLFGNGSLFQAIANILIFLIGAVSVIMIIVGGLRMVISSGNPANVKSARETILYAIVGVVIAIMSYAVIHFILGNQGLGKVS
jgi:hypothetical protein